MHQEGIYATHAFGAGARGYLSKASAPEKLVGAVRSIAARRRYVSPDVEQSMAQHPSSARQLAGSLSSRELEVLRLLARAG